MKKNQHNAASLVTRRVEAMLSQMILSEKISQVVHQTPAIPRLGVPEYNWWNECLHGVARAGKATVFPQAIGMAASFDTDLLFRVAAAVSTEARAKHNEAVRLGNRSQYFGLTYWSPNLNIFRDPRWGRGQETYGEDPYLTARLGVAFIRGLQGNHPKYRKVDATAKHYAVHSGPEPLRHGFNAIVGSRDLCETYLPHFKAAVEEAKVASVMGAYNRTNGEPCCASPTLLQKILREEWGFDGYVVSDCGALDDFHAHHKLTQTPAESAALAVKNGCDLNCGCTYCKLEDAVMLGLLTEEDINYALRRLLAARFKLGMFDPPHRVPWSRLRPQVVNCQAHRALARVMGRESIVLLKNNGVLPLRRNLRHLLVVGPNAMEQTFLIGNYNGFAPQMQTVLEGILDKVTPGTQVQWAKGCNLTGDRPPNRGELGWITSYGPPLDVIVAVGYNAFLEGEEGTGDGGGDRQAYGLPGRQQEYLEHLKTLGKPVVLVLAAGSPVDLNWAQVNVDAIVMAWYPGEQGGGAVADVLFGDYNPAGRLPVTFPKSYDQLPPFEDYAMKGRTYRFMDAEPLYRFGYGLSYTSFKYSKLKIQAAKSGFVVRAEVKNTGKVAGDEVVQLYVRDVEASVPVPRLHLEGFRRLRLRAGQKTTVAFPLRPEQLACYDDDGKPFVEPGDFEISVGGGQPGDPQSGALTTTLTVRGDRRIAVPAAPHPGKQRSRASATPAGAALQSSRNLDAWVQKL